MTSATGINILIILKLKTLPSLPYSYNLQCTEFSCAVLYLLIFTRKDSADSRMETKALVSFHQEVLHRYPEN